MILRVMRREIEEGKRNESQREREVDGGRETRKGTTNLFLTLSAVKEGVGRGKEHQRGEGTTEANGKPRGRTKRDRTREGS